MFCKTQEMITIPINKDYTFTFEQLNTISIFQRLFTQLSVFMRSYIYASVFNTEGKEDNAQRLMEVSEDLRDVFLLFYGPEVADRMNVLITNFIANVSNVIEGYVMNNEDLLNQSVQNWYESADKIAEFLAGINLFWDVNQWRNLLYQYIQLKLEMIVALYSRDYKREIQIYDRVFDLTTIMGTYMARGIIARELQKTQQTT